MRTTISKVLFWILAAAIVGVMFLFSPPKAQAATWGVATLASYHTDRSVKHNERNFGLGLERDVSDNVRLVGGFYDNSFYRESVYAGASWTPLRLGVVRVGVIGGGVTGYERSVIPMAAGLLSVEGEAVGMNILAIPRTSQDNPGVFGLQIKVRF